MLNRLFIQTRLHALVRQVCVRRLTNQSWQPTNIPSRKDINEAVGKGMDMAKESVGPKVSEAASNAAQAAKQQAASMGHSVSQAATHVTERVTQKAADMGHKVTQAAADMGSGLGHKAADVGHKVSATASQAAHDLGQKAADVGHKATDVASSAASDAKRMAFQVGEQFKSHTGPVILGIAMLAAWKANSLSREVKELQAKGKTFEDLVARETNKVAKEMIAKEIALSQGKVSPAAAAAVSAKN